MKNFDYNKSNFEIMIHWKNLEYGFFFISELFRNKEIDSGEERK